MIDHLGHIEVGADRCRVQADVVELAPDTSGDGVPARQVSGLEGEAGNCSAEEVLAHAMEGQPGEIGRGQARRATEVLCDRLGALRRVYKHQALRSHAR